ncbi:hypothetical protein [Nannocystis bainbridge]|uniref:Uncharacterized protein n=1 Tax=Nannocystis bainbridge TaxID=2995303 RepID=A0ABT5DQ14_9BACT|nr:hypothetical protein [Nannocystis bainbridge]MDC0715688.1 hypothetical protein [Nannocystis bainbridge]
MIALRTKPLRRPGLPFIGSRATVFAAGLLLELALATGCQKVCSDDGFAWQQDASCVAALSATESAGTDGTTDPSETMTAPTTGGDGGQWCVDADMDGFGDPSKCTDVPPGQTPPPGTVDNDGDCDDGDGKTFPGAAPNDDPDACMSDADDDDWGDSNPGGGGGGGGGGIVPGSDCDDSSGGTFPGAAPNDDPDACMKDEDGDDWGDNNPPGQGMGGVVPGTDCDDTNMSAWATCDGCTDADGDGWLSMCDAYPAEFPGPDCDDGDADTFPGAAPNDDANACMKDADGDDWGDDMPTNPGVTPGTDCDDNGATTFPGAAPNDDADACMKDEDDDDHGDAAPGPGVTPGSDCYDQNPVLNPSHNVLVTAPITTGEILEVDPADGSLTPYASVDVGLLNPWIPTSLAVHPVDGSVYAALAFRDRLMTMDYCGAGTPTPLPAAHKKNICGITFDRAGDLYGIDGQVDQLLRFNPDGSLSPENIKPLTFEGKTLNVADCGMAFDCHEQRLLVSDSISGGIYVVNPDDGTATRIADVSQEPHGSGLEYDPTSKLALSCDQTSLLSIALDGSNDFTKLADLAAPVDDLTFGPTCN